MTATAQPLSAPVESPGEKATAPGTLASVVEAPREGEEVFRLTWNRKQIELLKNTVARSCTDDEIALFAHVCHKTGLDPFAKQIHALKRSRKKDDGSYEDVMVIQTGIDGYRLIRQRTREFEGLTKPEWCGPDGVWKEVWLEMGPPAAARIGCYRKGFREPVYSVALYREYVQTLRSGQPNRIWSERGAAQLLKCAEALASRSAFPQELSGLYTHEEMEQADSEGPFALLGNGENGSEKARRDTKDSTSASSKREPTETSKAPNVTLDTPIDWSSHPNLKGKTLRELTALQVGKLDAERHRVPVGEWRVALDARMLEIDEQTREAEREATEDENAARAIPGAAAPNKETL